MSDVLFPGFNTPINRQRWAQAVQLPERVYSVDGKRFIRVDLDSMKVPSDSDGEPTFKLNESLSCFMDMTHTAAAHVLLAALDGKRKTSTVRRWLNELSLFGRTIAEAIGNQRISTVTLKMYLWYCKQKSASQEKLLRGVFLYWIKEECPGLESELEHHLQTTAPRKPRGMIEVQNAVPSERPLSMSQVRGLLQDIEELYLSGEFSPQTNLLWRLMISEALRPAQMELLQFGDVTIKRDGGGRLQAVELNVPMIKQAGTPARDYMESHRLSRALSQAVVDHIEFVGSVHGKEPPKTWPLFCVRLATDKKTLVSRKPSIGTHALIAQTRTLLASIRGEFEDTDLFNRRFKHTKLTHLAAAGAPLEVLAHAGFQTSTISLVRYVNLTEEAYAGYETRLEPAHLEIAAAFRGKVIARTEATNPDDEHRIVDPNLEHDLGACAAEPCGALACKGCYLCPRYEAFEDGPHKMIEAQLVAEQERARAAGMPAETILKNDQILRAVRFVITRIESGS